MADAPRTVPSRRASSNAAGELLQDYQVMHGRIPNRCERNACIERDKAYLMPNGEGKEVEVGNNLSDGLLFALRPLLRGLQDVFRCPIPWDWCFYGPWIRSHRAGAR